MARRLKRNLVMPPSSSVTTQNETVETSETNETHFFNALSFSHLGCGNKGQIPAISKKCNFPTHFPVLKLNPTFSSTARHQDTKPSES